MIKDFGCHIPATR